MLRQSYFYIKLYLVDLSIDYQSKDEVQMQHGKYRVEHANMLRAPFKRALHVRTILWLLALLFFWEWWVREGSYVTTEMNGIDRGCIPRNTIHRFYPCKRVQQYHTGRFLFVMPMVYAPPTASYYRACHEQLWLCSR